MKTTLIIAVIIFFLALLFTAKATSEVGGGIGIDIVVAPQNATSQNNNTGLNATYDNNTGTNTKNEHLNRNNNYNKDKKDAVKNINNNENADNNENKDDIKPIKLALNLKNQSSGRNYLEFLLLSNSFLLCIFALLMMTLKKNM